MVELEVFFQLDLKCFRDGGVFFLQHLWFVLNTFRGAAVAYLPVTSRFP